MIRTKEGKYFIRLNLLQIKVLQQKRKGLFSGCVATPSTVEGNEAEGTSVITSRARRKGKEPRPVGNELHHSVRS